MKQIVGETMVNSHCGLKPGLYFERKSVAYTQTILRTCKLGRVFSATNADLRRRDRVGAEYKHSYNTPTWMLDCHWLIARDLCVYAGFYAEYKINPSP